jgi:hypothetical protein
MENDEFIFAGKRRLKKAPGQVEVGSSKGWSLYRMPLSSCGRFQNYRLYLDDRSSKKNVWFLGTYSGSGELVKSREVEILDTYYGGMVEWLTSAIKGVILEAPVEGSNGAAFQTKGRPVSEETTNKILDVIDKAWEDGKPLSYFGQTEPLGRYAVKEVSAAIKLSKTKVKAALKEMKDDGIIATTMFDRHKKIRGLKSARMVEQEERGLADWQASGLAGRQEGGLVTGGSSNGNG